MIQDLLVDVVVAVALLYLARTLVLPHFAPSKKPDVPLSKLVRRRAK